MPQPSPKEVSVIMPSTKMSRLLALALLSVFGFGLVACASDGEYRPVRENEAIDKDAYRDEIDILLETGAQHYEKGDFTSAYIASRRAFEMSMEIKEDDIQAHMMMGWSLLFLRRFDDFPYQERMQPGASSIFEEILQSSPNEFKARQGVATISFHQHFISSRKAKVFRELRTELAKYLEELSVLVPNLGTSGGQRNVLLDLERRWSFERGFVPLYRQSYARPEGLWEDKSQPEREISGADYPGWARENFLLDQVTYSLREGYIADAKKQITTLDGWCAARMRYWEERSLEHLSSALKGFEDLRRTGGTIYYAIHRDIGLTHLAAGSYFLSKGLEVARAEIAKTPVWETVPDYERESVLRSYYNDKELHTSNPWRESANTEFAKALESLEVFIREDKRFEDNLEKGVAAKGEEFATLTNVDAVQTEIIDIYQRGFVDQLNTVRGQRKSILMQMISLLIKPEYGARDYAKAEIYARELTLADINDPIQHMVRGHILELQERFDDAVEAYKEFMAQSSITSYVRQRTWVRERISTLTLQLREEEAKRSREQGTRGSGGG